MCGIAGILSLNREAVDPGQLRQMTDALAHRGPDGQGQWTDPEQQVGLGHRRLSVIDLSDLASQPMHYFARYTISYNGEIYNYIELREELTAKGHVFRSDSDTEVILAAYAEFGTACPEHFDGMFAFAIWDREKKELFCARDRFGEKPFYYTHDPKQRFCFASEIKGLFAAGAGRETDPQMLFYYLNYDVVDISHDKRRTFYREINSLEAGHYLKIGRGQELIIRPYWKLSPQPTSHLSFEKACEQFHELFFRSVSRRLRSDVPTGSSLSGGLDSSAIVLVTASLMNGKGVQKTFSARFHDPALDEGPYIEQVTAGRNIEAHHTYPSADILVREFDRLFRHQEQPFGSASIFAQWEVMKLAQEQNVTVLLDGQGGDEILAGYPRYFHSYFKELYKNDRQAFMRERKAYERLHQTKVFTGLAFLSEVYFPRLLMAAGKWKRKLPDSANYMQLNKEFFGAYKDQPSPFQYFNTLNEDLHHSTVCYGLEKLLRFSDRNSMAFSREVRMPFLSHELVEFLFSLPSHFKLQQGLTKYILREAMKKELPEGIRSRVNKIGFEPPQKDWLQCKEMREMTREARSALIGRGILTEQSAISDWQAVMAAQMFHFSNSGYR